MKHKFLEVLTQKWFSHIVGPTRVPVTYKSNFHQTECYIPSVSLPSPVRKTDRHTVSVTTLSTKYPHLEPLLGSSGTRSRNGHRSGQGLYEAVAAGKGGNKLFAIFAHPKACLVTWMNSDTK